MREVMWMILGGCLLFACVTDCRTRLVYNVTWWISGTAAMVLLVTGHKLSGMQGVMELGVFMLLQLLFFSKFYGKADCYAFCVCAVAEAAVGMGILDYLLHMLWAFLLLAFVQGVRRNINRKGNLKQPVPFLPYITLAFWALLWYHYTC